jgi:hypothetical protein
VTQPNAQRLSRKIEDSRNLDSAARLCPTGGAGAQSPRSFVARRSAPGQSPSTQRCSAKGTFRLLRKLAALLKALPYGILSCVRRFRVGELGHRIG